ncbi:hypothetical protein RB195_021078 [Necator americanus]|uniref:Uncharacterized protein n=1 Tax=Necator americanus TaxID=51031 RepID=A0ABR1E9W5_NECAM
MITLHDVSQADRSLHGKLVQMCSYQQISADIYACQDIVYKSEVLFPTGEVQLQHIDRVMQNEKMPSKQFHVTSSSLDSFLTQLCSLKKLKENIKTPSPMMHEFQQKNDRFSSVTSCAEQNPAEDAESRILVTSSLAVASSTTMNDQSKLLATNISGSFLCHFFTFDVEDMAVEDLSRSRELPFPSLSRCNCCSSCVSESSHPRLATGELSTGIADDFSRLSSLSQYICSSLFKVFLYRLSAELCELGLVKMFYKPFIFVVVVHDGIFPKADKRSEELSVEDGSGKGDGLIPYRSLVQRHPSGKTYGNVVVNLSMIPSIG